MLTHEGACNLSIYLCKLNKFMFNFCCLKLFTVVCAWLVISASIVDAYAPLAQLAEQLTLNQRVPGSSPGGRTKWAVKFLISPPSLVVLT